VRRGRVAVGVDGVGGGGGDPLRGLVSGGYCVPMFLLRAWLLSLRKPKAESAPSPPPQDEAKRREEFLRAVEQVEREYGDLLKRLAE